MREIGGYIELDTYRLPMLHESAIALNCGRNALAYLLKARKIKRLWIPKFICDSVTGVCGREGVPYTFYSVGVDFLPSQEIRLGEDDWFYFVNYYSQFDNGKIAEYVAKYKRIIVDHAQSYFQLPLPGIDTLYTCRKYFGVADGAILYTDAKLDVDFPRDESFERMHFLLGRFERTASEFYSEYAANNDLFATEPIKRMSKLTENLLHGIDYEQTKAVREQNYLYLHRCLKDINGLKLCERPGTFMYPLLLENGAEVRKNLLQKKIYIPTLWPDVLEWCGENETEYQMAKNILPLPIDQRYGVEEMSYLVEEIKNV
ncbi:MAG: hypothetical protein IKP00_03790 [Victivallales bacterium]|nr:hypothetical protein [Victivallales bacterium]